MTEHTPTPWHATRKSAFVNDMRNRMVAEMAVRPEREANAAFIEMAVNSHDALINALTLFLATDETMEGILWGKEPDTALVKITIPLGQYREARKALSRVKGVVGPLPGPGASSQPSDSAGDRTGGSK